MQNRNNIQWTVTGLAVAGLLIGGYIVFIQHRKKGTKGIKGGFAPNIPRNPKQSPGGGVVEEPNWKNPYDMNYLKDVKRWVGKKMMRKLSERRAKEYARIIKGARGRWRDDTEAVAKVFTRLKDKTQVASISKAFWGDYKKDMWQYLNGFLNKTEMEKYVHRPVRELDNYRLI